MLGNTEYIHSGGGGWGGGGEGGWLGMLLVIALLGGGRGFFGHGGEGNHSADIERIQLMMNDNQNNRFNQISGEIAAGENRAQVGHLNQGMVAGFNNIAREVGQLGFQNAMIAKDGIINANEHSFGIQRNVDQLRFDMSQGFCSVNMNGERNTHAIIGAINAASQRQIDWLTANEMKEAYAEIAKLNGRLNTQEIVSTITGSLQPPRPVPSYAAPNPFEQFVAPVRVVAPPHLAHAPQGHGHFNNC
jgi:virulence-associated protein VapD